MFGAEYVVEGVGAERAVEKLVQGGVPVLSAQKIKKNAVRIRVDGKHRKKVFAILQGSCYNITKERAVGAVRLWRRIAAHAGCLAGAALFLAAVCLLQGRVLAVSVVGSGAYYRSEVLRALERQGVHFLSPAPQEQAAVTAYVLSLPRVSFCSLSLRGGVLTVTVETEDEASAPETGALTAPRSGVVEKIAVVRGRALAAAGDEVAAGDTIAVPAEEGGLLIACVTVRYAVDCVYEGGEDAVRAQSYLDHGEIADLTLEKTETGYRVTGSARATASRNLG